MVIYLSIALIVTVAGVLMYVLCANAKLQEIGRIAFAMGLLAFLLRVTDFIK